MSDTHVPTPERSSVEAAEALPIHGFQGSPEDIERQWYEQIYRKRGERMLQLTWRAVLMGSVLGGFLSLTNLYIGLKAGWSFGVAITACILSYAIGTALHRARIFHAPMTILENNCMQSTASSSGYSTSVLLVTAIPAMLLLSVTDDNPRGTQLRWYVVCAWILCVAALGVLLAIPMKRSMINHERLKFPSGTAAAVLLQSLYSEGAEALAKGRALLVSGAVGFLVPLLKDLNAIQTVDASHSPQANDPRRRTPWPQRPRRTTVTA